MGIEHDTRNTFYFYVPKSIQLSIHAKICSCCYFSRSVRLNDPLWEKMWYLNRGEDLDMNVEGAWEEGVTGKGVAVTILDDGENLDN